MGPNRTAGTLLIGALARPGVGGCRIVHVPHAGHPPVPVALATHCARVWKAQLVQPSLSRIRPAPWARASASANASATHAAAARTIIRIVASSVGGWPRHHPNISQRTGRRIGHSFITDELVERNLIQRLRSAHTIESMQVAGDRGLGGLTEEEVRGIKAPTILVWGANDKISPPANADKLNAAIRDSRKVLIDRAGHYPFLEHPDKFNQVVMEFLKSQS